MSDRIATQMSELMNDLYEVMGDPDALLNPAPAPEPEATNAHVFKVVVGDKTYSVDYVSRSKKRNIKLMACAVTSYANATDAAEREAIAAFMRVLAAAL